MSGWPDGRLLRRGTLWKPRNDFPNSSADHSSPIERTALRRRHRDRRRRSHRRPVDDQHRYGRRRGDRGPGQGAGATPAPSWCASPSTPPKPRPRCRAIRERLDAHGLRRAADRRLPFQRPQAADANIPDCARALAKYRINPGNVGKGSKRDPQFAEMIEKAIEFGKPVRIGVNWGSLDQDLLARMMDENARAPHPLRRATQ